MLAVVIEMDEVIIIRSGEDGLPPKCFNSTIKLLYEIFEERNVSGEISNTKLVRVGRSNSIDYTKTGTWKMKDKEKVKR